MNTIHIHNLAPLLGRGHHSGNDVDDAVCKSVHVSYAQDRTECSVMSNWVVAVPQFADRQSKRTFRIK